MEVLLVRRIMQEEGYPVECWIALQPELPSPRKLVHGEEEIVGV